ncbi:MAG: alpha/beta fold hydrolase [bacterium]
MRRIRCSAAILFVFYLLQPTRVFLSVPNLFAQTPETPYPILFVHGLESSDQTWDRTINELGVYVGDFGESHVFHAVLNAYADMTNLYGPDGITGNKDDDVLILFNNEDNQLGNGQIYAINFENFWNQQPDNPRILKHRSDTPGNEESPSNQAAIYKQGYALGKMIEAVIRASGARKVILVGHSMGGLAIREYLQRRENGRPKWWVDPQDAQSGHKVAKVVTIGTPHLGSNFLDWPFGLAEREGEEQKTARIPNLKSEAVRDLRFNYNIFGLQGRYLFGGGEGVADLLTMFYNMDVNCDGDENDEIIGLNEGEDGETDNVSMPLPDTIEYTWITSNATGIFNGDGIVDLSRQWLHVNDTPAPLGLADTLLTHRPHFALLGKAGETEDFVTIIRGLDEPDTPALAYVVQTNKEYWGFRTLQSNWQTTDYDWYRFSFNGGTVRILIGPTHESSGRIDFYAQLPVSNANSSLFLTFNGSNPVAYTPPISLEANTTYYVRITNHNLAPDDWQYPYTLRLEGTDDQISNVDVALVIDRSGSMEGEKLAAAKTAAKSFVGFMQAKDNLAIVSFATSATVAFRLTEITSDATKSAAQNGIQAISSGGATTIGGGIRVAQDELDKGDRDHPHAMLLLSDGQETAPPDVVDVLPSIPDKTDIYTIGLGVDADQDLLSNIASQTGGTFHFSPSADELQKIYLQIQGKLRGQQTIASNEGTISQNQSVSYSVPLDGLTSQAVFSMLFEGSDVDLELVAPSGSRITPQVASSDPDITYNEGDTYDFYTVSAPQDGEWTLKITGVDVPTPETFFTSVQVNSQLKMEVFPDKEEYSAGEAILLSARLQENGDTIAGASVTVEVVAPSSSVTLYRLARHEADDDDPRLTWMGDNAAPQFVASTFTLFDDGRHGDGQANDGVYANRFTNTASDGSYTFTVEASGLASQGGAFRREAILSTIVTPATGFIQVTNPNSGDVWEKGTEHRIKWDSNAGGNVKIRLYRGSVFVKRIISSTDNDGNYRWVVPEQVEAGSGYRIRITSRANSSIEDDSDAFTIADPADADIALLGLSGETVYSVLLHPTNKDIIYAGTRDVGVHKSSDYGGTFTRLTSGLTDHKIFKILMDPGNPNVLYLGTGGDNNSSSESVFKSTNAGASWAQKNSGLPSKFVFALARTSANTLYAGTNGTGIYKSTSGATQWTSANSGVASGVEIHSFAVHPNDSRTLFAGTRRGLMYKTTNGGSTWSLVDLPGNTDYVLSIVFDPAKANTMFVATFGHGVYKSTNGGNSWFQTNDGLGDLQVNHIVFTPGGEILLGTRSGGIFKSTDGGITWSHFGGGIFSKVHHLVFSRLEPNIFYVGARDGIYRVNDPNALFITVTSPAVGSDWEQGTNHNIEWSSNATGQVQISLHRGGNEIEIIAANTGNDGQHTWQVSSDLPAANDYTVRVGSVSHSAPFDYSDEFAVSETPFLAILSPSTDSDWQRGSTQTIEWTSNAGGSVRIRLFRGNSIIQTISNTTENDGSFPWSVPTSLTAADDYRIRITSTSTSSLEVTSATFTISDAPFLQVVIPDSEDIWLAGTTQTIEWDSNVQGNVRIRLYRGAALQQTIRSSTPNDGSDDWNIPGTIPAANDYRIRLTSTSNSALDDTSDAFTIDNVTSVEPRANGVPRHYALRQNYPNPFNPETEIRFELPQAQQVVLTVYSLLGEEIVRLLNETKPAGVHAVQWNGRDKRGMQVASGIFVYQMRAGEFVMSRKLVLVR